MATTIARSGTRSGATSRRQNGHCRATLCQAVIHTNTAFIQKGTVHTLASLKENLEVQVKCNYTTITNETTAIAYLFGIFQIGEVDEGKSTRPSSLNKPSRFEDNGRQTHTSSE
ncbi:hypothetical protein RvY_09402 [Ramazzottius varieornatus]|uniref:Uncharacterized protein n=1 Tax=Ramazzottius varieornatus TaxID=947166 RepID=A0A1D1V987_RAMVA|nr:hypothetical protein RvY_09402 [Ramazzottius varieornatus]